MGTLFVGLILLVMVACAFLSLIRDRKHGKTSCGGSCASCAGCAHSCESRKE